LGLLVSNHWITDFNSTSFNWASRISFLDFGLSQESTGSWLLVEGSSPVFVTLTYWSRYTSSLSSWREQNLHEEHWRERPSAFPCCFPGLCWLYRIVLLDG
jgi:hypothetical protein